MVVFSYIEGRPSKGEGETESGGEERILEVALEGKEKERLEQVEVESQAKN